MTYEKAYKKALERARAIYQGKYKPEIAATLAEALQSIFPELAGSKDERIKKCIIDTLKGYHHLISTGGVTKEDMIAWIEKQGKQRPEVDTLNAFKNAMKGEQHPAAEHKAKDVENDICRECDNGNWLANLCWKGHSRCDGQKCIDFEKDEEL